MFSCLSTHWLYWLIGRAFYLKFLVDQRNFPGFLFRQLDIEIFDISTQDFKSQKTFRIKHTRFPKDWDEARIRAEVTSAWEKRKELEGQKWRGTSKSGVEIEGFTEPNRTAYPLYNSK